MQKRSRWIDAAPIKRCNVKNGLRLDLYCSIQPGSLVADFGNGLGNRNP
ncbi:hypothetical protein [Natrinema altunense]|nr:hypothetical protein [Natrinema altunense]